MMTSYTLPQLTVHPHVRGEYHIRRDKTIVYIGSPPRAWGIRLHRLLDALFNRFTPTCVGNTSLDTGRSLCYAVHPHVRGEYRVLGKRSRPHYGSPPRAWGIRQRPTAKAAVLRFTPTCVGNTPMMSLPVTVNPVHPHVRGEYADISEATRATRGSPPRAWGIPGDYALLPNRGRFTPTCVGNTGRPSRRLRKRAVHPHVRGEYVDGDVVRQPRVGSPPRAWGIPCKAWAKTGPKRFTPTCVGNTTCPRLDTS